MQQHERRGQRRRKRNLTEKNLEQTTRMPDWLKAKLDAAAQDAGVSTNRYMVELLETHFATQSGTHDDLIEARATAKAEEMLRDRLARILADLRLANPSEAKAKEVVAA